MPTSRSVNMSKFGLVGALSGVASLAVVGAISASTGTFTGRVSTPEVFSGATLYSGTGITVGDTDGGGCTRIQAIDGTVSGKSVTCP